MLYLSLLFIVLALALVHNYKTRDQHQNQPIKPTERIAKFSLIVLILTVLINAILLVILFSPKPSSHQGGFGSHGFWGYFIMIFVLSIPALLLAVVGLILKNNLSKMVISILASIPIGIAIYILYTMRDKISDLIALW